MSFLSVLFCSKPTPWGPHLYFRNFDFYFAFIYSVTQAAEYLEKPDMMCHLVDPELRYFKHDDLRVVCNAVSLCIQSDPSKRPAMKEICRMLENGIDTSAAADLKESPLAWAELVLSS